MYAMKYYGSNIMYQPPSIKKQVNFIITSDSPGYMS